MAKENIICKNCGNFNKEANKCSLNEIIIKNRREVELPLTPVDNKCFAYKGKVKNAVA